MDRGVQVLQRRKEVRMDVNFINPFVESVLTFFSKMLRADAERGEVGLAMDVLAPGELTALIGMGGPVRGTVAITFPVSTALQIVTRLTGVKTKVVDEVTYDAVSEAVNIVTGRAKAQLTNEGEVPVVLSLPSVVRGSDYTVIPPSKSSWLDIPFTSDLGPFSLRITMESGTPEGDGS